MDISLLLLTNCIEKIKIEFILQNEKKFQSLHFISNRLGINIFKPSKSISISFYKRNYDFRILWMKTCKKITIKIQFGGECQTGKIPGLLLL